MRRRGPCFCAGDSPLEVPDEPSAAPEPGEGAFDDPSSRFLFEHADAFDAGDDLDRPVARLRYDGKQLGSPIGAIGEDMGEAREACPQADEQGDRAMAVLNIGGMQKADGKEALQAGEIVAKLRQVDALVLQGYSAEADHPINCKCVSE